MHKICVVTGSRAEYWLLYWLMKEIQQDDALQLQIAVTGSHFASDLGTTYKKIEADGFIIDDKIEMLLASDTAVGITKSMGLGLIGFADSFERLKPDMVVLLGDRFEIFVAAQAAMIGKIPTAHLHGGEATFGAFDESIRHAITKMSHLHFVAAEEYGHKIKQLGENPEFIFDFGAPGLDQMVKTQILTKEAFEDKIGKKFGKFNFLVTYHPQTLNVKNNKINTEVQELLAALESFPSAHIIFTMPNADTQNKAIQQAIIKFVNNNPDRAILVDTLGFQGYISAVAYSDVVIGNSSSGLTEVPLLKKPTVNLGSRQEGRISPLSVIHCEEKREDIIRAIDRAMSKSFQPEINKIPDFKNNDYKPGEISIKIKNKIKEVMNQGDSDKLLIKRFYSVDNYNLNNNIVENI